MTSSTIGYGFSRASVTKVSLGAGTVSVKIPALNGNVTFDNVPFYGDNPSVNDDIVVGYLEGLKATPIAISIAGGSSLETSAVKGDIEGVTAGLGLSGGGTTGTVSLAFAPSELSSVTVATDDKVVIADTSDSDNPKHVTAQSIANLASVSPAGSDTQVQFNNSGSFGASSNMVFDGTNLDIAGLKIGGTAVTSTAAELNLVDGITAGTVSASLAVIVDSNKDITGFRNVTLTGELDAATLDVSGDVDIDGTTNLDAVDIDGNVQLDGTFDVGADGGGYDVRFYGGESGSLFFYDESASNLLVRKQVTNVNTHDPVLLLGGIETADVNLEIGAGPGIDFYIPYDGSTSLGASIAAEKRSDTDADNATGLVFKVSANGVTTPVRAMSILSDGSVIIGDNTTNGPKLQEGTSDTLRIESGDGRIDIGCMNASGNHIYGENATMFLGVSSSAAVRITSSELSPYTDESSDLGSQAYTWNKLWLGQGTTFSSGGYWTLRSRDSDRQVMELVSSERYKKDIVDLPLSEAYQVLDARVIKYRGADDDETVPLEVGLSAESLHEAGYEYAVRYDEGHWGETPRSIYYEYLTAPLIKIVKDLKERIEALES